MEVKTIKGTMMEANKHISLSSLKNNLEGKKITVEMDEFDFEKIQNYELLAKFFSDTLAAVNFQVNSNHSIWDDKYLVSEIYKKAKDVNTEITMKFLGQK